MFYMVIHIWFTDLTNKLRIICEFSLNFPVDVLKRGAWGSAGKLGDLGFRPYQRIPLAQPKVEPQFPAQIRWNVFQFFQILNFMLTICSFSSQTQQIKSTYPQPRRINKQTKSKFYSPITKLKLSITFQISIIKLESNKSTLTRNPITTN